MEAYDPHQNQWMDLPAMSTARSGLGVGVLDGLLYACGGWRSGVVEVYNPTLRAWITLSPMPAPRCNPGVAAADGLLYVCGGCDARGNATSSVYSYKPSTGQWKEEPPMNYVREGLGVVSVGDLIYAVGGTGRETSNNAQPEEDEMQLSSSEVFDPTTGVWTVLDDMPGPRDALALVHVQDEE